MSDGQERTERATPRKRKKARREGHIGNSAELGTWLGMLGASFVLPWMFRSLESLSSTTLVQAAAMIRSPDSGRAVATAEQAFEGALRIALPLGCLIALVSVASVAAQGGLWFAPNVWKPKFSRMNPLAGLKRMFGPQSVWSLAKSLLKIGALAVVLLVSMRPLLKDVEGSGALPLSALIAIAVSTALNLLRYAAAAGIVMSLADFAVTRKRNNKQLKMTKHEVKEEHRSTEGDPHLRGARRSRALAMSRNRMMAEVATADVVVVNPTHVAVALRYDAARGAPRVVAKGADHVAARIRELADKHRVPMVSDVALARTLHSTCKLGQEIPPDLYRAVATVLAFIMTLKRRGSAVGVHTVRTLVPAH